MSFLLMGLAFAAMGFVVTNAVLSLATVLLWRRLRTSLRGAGPLFWLRMSPAVGSVGLVMVLVLPAFWIFEPRGTAETAGPALVAIVLLAATLVAAGVRRGVAGWRRTRSLELAWRAAAVRGAGLGLPVPAYRVPCDMPLAALVGILRPRLYIADRFVDGLSADERQAVLDHEAGHLLSGDNLRRAAMRLAPDWLGLTSAGREIEAAWSNAAEDAADDHASGPDRARSLDLAGALLKASRLMPMRGAPASNFSDEATIARRVARLLEDHPAHRAPRRGSTSRLVWVAALLGAAALLAGPALPLAYAMMEAAVRLLH